MSVDIKYSLRDLLFDVNNYADPQTSDMRHIYGKRYQRFLLLMQLALTSCEFYLETIF